MRLLTILGPTASGKTALAIALAKKVNGAIISADSRQVFRGMDIGTGKDLQQYGTIPYYLIDVKNPGEPYHVAAYANDFLQALEQVRVSGKTPLLCGGTGLYLQAALKGLPYAFVPVNAELRQRLEQLETAGLQQLFRDRPSAYTALADTSTRKRLIRAIEISTYLREHPGFPPQRDPYLQGSPQDDSNERFLKVSAGGSRPEIAPLVLGIHLPPDIRRARITERLQRRLKEGLLEEVQQLLTSGITPQQLIFYGLEYKFAVLHLQGELTGEEFFKRLNTAIHQFAKRQMTFFRKLEREGLPIHWIDGRLPLEEQLGEACQLLSIH